jgi:tetratricopeptide (TPR) repeat protein
LKENFRGEEHCEKYLEPGNVFKSLDYLKSLDYISGHIMLDVFDKNNFSKKDYFLMTFLRVPLSQLISHLNWVIHIYDISPKFFAGHPKHIQQMSLELRGLNLYDPDSFISALKKFQGLFKNSQSRYFVPNPFLGDVEKIIEKILKLDLLGMTEDYQGAIENLIRLNELNIKPEVHQVNRNPSYRVNKDILDNKIIDEFIQEYNQIDTLVYEYFLRKNKQDSLSVQIKIDQFTQLKNLADELKKQQSYEKAVITYQQAIELRPKNANLYYLLGTVLEQQGDLDGAISNYQQAVHLNPNLVRHHKSLGDILRKQKRFTEAISSYQKAIDINPENANLYYLLAKVLEIKGDFPLAIRNYQKALELGPDNPKYSQSLLNIKRRVNINL